MSGGWPRGAVTRTGLLCAVAVVVLPALALAEAPARSPRPAPLPAEAPGRAQPDAGAALLAGLHATGAGPVLGFSDQRPRPRSVTPGEIDLSQEAGPPLGFDGQRPRPRPEQIAAAAAPRPRASIAAGIGFGSTAQIAAFPTIAGRPAAAATIPFASMGRPPAPAGAGGDMQLAALPPAAGVETGPGGFVCGIPSIRGKQIADRVEAVRGCGMNGGVSVTRLSGVELSTPIEVDCPTARRLNGWIEGVVLPLVGPTGGGIEGLEMAGSYNCRTRNHQPGAKISEHGKGRAVDITGLRLRDGTVLTVAEDWNDPVRGKILRMMHRAACGPFGTVLGPGSDGFHEDHLHLDTAVRRQAYCR